MPIQILPQEEGISEKLGRGLGTGLGSGLQQLAQLNMQQMLSSKQAVKTKSALESLGFSPEQASSLSNLDPSILREIVKAQQRAPQEQAFAEALRGLSGASPLATEQKNQTGQIGFQNALQKSPGLNSQQSTKLLELQMRKDELDRKEKSELRKLQHAEESAVQKETKEYYDKVVETDRAAKDSLHTLTKMETLIERGKLPPAALYKFVNEIKENIPSKEGALIGGAIGTALGGPGTLIGAAIGAAVSPIASLVESGIKYAYPDAEQFEKLSVSFISGAKALFGSRITDRDLQVFLQGIPTLSQTENGKKQIINNMKILYEAAEVRTNAMKKIIKENKGKRPANLPLLVEEYASKELNRLADQFIAGT